MIDLVKLAKGGNLEGYTITGRRGMPTHTDYRCRTHPIETALTFNTTYHYAPGTDVLEAVSCDECAPTYRWQRTTCTTCGVEYLSEDGQTLDWNHLGDEHMVCGGCDDDDYGYPESESDRTLAWAYSDSDPNDDDREPGWRM